MLNKYIMFSNSKKNCLNNRVFNIDQNNQDYDFFSPNRAALPYGMNRSGGAQGAPGIHLHFSNALIQSNDLSEQRETIYIAVGTVRMFIEPSAKHLPL